MYQYRVFCLHGAKIISAEYLQAATDAEALKAATLMGKGTLREVWRYERLIGRVRDPAA